jgi:hypothetical protein
MIEICDPVEREVARALSLIGQQFRRGRSSGEADFILQSGVQIECKAFFSERAIRQMDGKKAAILIQGADAAQWFSEAIQKAYARGREETTNE